MAAIYDSSRYEAEAHRNAPHAPNALLTDLFVRTDLSLQHQVFTLQRKRSPVHNLLQLTARIHTQHTGNHNLQNGRPALASQTANCVPIVAAAGDFAIGTSFA